MIVESGLTSIQTTFFDKSETPSILSSVRPQFSYTGLDVEDTYDLITTDNLPPFCGDFVPVINCDSVSAIGLSNVEITSDCTIDMT